MIRLFYALVLFLVADMGGISAQTPPPCTIGWTATSPDTLCPGDCRQFFGAFEVLPDTAAPARIWVFSSFSGVSSGGIAAYSSTLLSSDVSLLLPHLTTADSSFAVSVCAQIGTNSPIEVIVAVAFSDTLCPISLDTFWLQVAPMPNLSNLPFEIQSPITFASLTTVTNGAAVQFNLGSPTPYDTDVFWQYRDDSGPWQNISEPAFDKFTFVVPSNNPLLTTDCDTSTIGYVDRVFRGVIDLFSGGDTCRYITQEYALRICCPFQFSLTATPDTVLCEGDSLTVHVELSSGSPFVVPPGPETDILWYINGQPQPQLTDSLSFSTGIETTAQGVPIRAVVAHCGGTIIREKQIKGDPKPLCGLIFKAPEDTNLTLGYIDTTTGFTSYYICEEGDGVLSSTPFLLCTPEWQSSYDSINWDPYQVEGISNTKLNTNILIPDNQTSIFYRVKGIPGNPANACGPCYSNTIKVSYLPDFAVPDIQVPLTACAETPIEMSVTNPQPGITYKWYINGEMVGIGIDVSAISNRNANIWCVASNGCEDKASALKTVPVVRLEVASSCPIFPNECACLNQPITLAAGVLCSLPSPELAFLWSWSDGSSTAASITDIPPVGGELYTIQVTELTTGCTAVNYISVVPCDKN